MKLLFELQQAVGFILLSILIFVACVVIVAFILAKLNIDNVWVTFISIGALVIFILLKLVKHL